MNLIEQLGGYEKAKTDLKDKQWRKDNLNGSSEFTWHMEQHIQLLEAVLLQYRRQHNIFEVGDLVVFKDQDNALDKNGLGKGEVLKVKEIDFYDYLIFDCSRYGHGQKWFRHATDAEIKAGKRLEVL